MLSESVIYMIHVILKSFVLVTKCMFFLVYKDYFVRRNHFKIQNFEMSCQTKKFCLNPLEF